MKFQSQRTKAERPSMEIGNAAEYMVMQSNRPKRVAEDAVGCTDGALSRGRSVMSDDRRWRNQRTEVSPVKPSRTAPTTAIARWYRRWRRSIVWLRCVVALMIYQVLYRLPEFDNGPITSKINAIATTLSTWLRLPPPASFPKSRLPRAKTTLLSLWKGRMKIFNKRVQTDRLKIPIRP